jgi:hypothetical protein
MLAASITKDKHRVSFLEGTQTFNTVLSKQVETY